MIITYTNNSAQVFEGFYESNLLNSDMESRVSEYMDDEKTYEINDYNAYTKDIAKTFVDIVKEHVPEHYKIVNDIKFAGLYSPSFYNYGTDKVEMEVNLNEDNLKKLCFSMAKDAFRVYLKDNFTSCSGFISFIPNTIESFKRKLEEGDDDERLYNAMFEFFLLNCMDMDEVTYLIEEYAQQKIFEYCEPID